MFSKARSHIELSDIAMVFILVMLYGIASCIVTCTSGSGVESGAAIAD